MYSLRKLVWGAYIVVGAMLAVIILFGASQYVLSRQYTAIIEQSEKAIFQFATIRESVTETLIDEEWQRLGRLIDEIEQLNAALVRLQKNPLIPPELKLVMVDKVDLAGMTISMRRLLGGEKRSEERKKLQEQMRSIADHLLHYDRIIVNQARGRILNFQMVIIGAMGLIIALASFSLNKLYRNTVQPLLRISNQLQGPNDQFENLAYGPETCKEVAELIDEINDLAAGFQQISRGSGGIPEADDRLPFGELVNETTNQLNGIINYAQILVDDTRGVLSEQDKELLQKIIDSCTAMAARWQSFNSPGALQ